MSSDRPFDSANMVEMQLFFPGVYEHRHTHICILNTYLQILIHIRIQTSVYTKCMYIHTCIHKYIYKQDDVDNTIMWVNSLMTISITGVHATASDAVLSGCNAAVMPVDGMYVCVCVCVCMCIRV